MKVYKAVLQIIDLEDVSVQEIRDLLENVDYIAPTLVSLESREIGEWSNDHPLNKADTAKEEFEKLFS